jgi:CHAT domain-containing protein
MLRGVLALSSGRSDAAVALLAEATRVRTRDHGAGHHHTALAMGWHGAALVASGDAVRQAEGTELLKQAVLDLEAPRNADFNNERGLRSALRDRVLAAHLKASTAKGGLAALWAFGVADSMRGGVTTQAMAEAALRAFATDPEAAALVRQEQDARRELRAAEALLQGNPGEGAASAPTGDAQAQLRLRASELESTRQQLQQRIRERFPAYERLARPRLPDPAAIAQRLRPHEAFVLLVPSDDALLAWAVVPSELPVFVRTPVQPQRLAALVARVRSTLDLESGRWPGPFDAGAAHELYRHLFAPLAARIGPAREWIVAPAGVLATLPLATLVTAAPAGNAPLSWLMRERALVQVPSAASWLALREAPRPPPAAEPLLAWGDPVFMAPRSLQPNARPNMPAARPAAPGRPTREAPPPERDADTRAATPRQYSDLPPLPESRAELAAIAAALKANPARDLLLGAAATRASLLAASSSGALAKKRVLVFATHGLVAGDLPGLAQPALALSAAPDAKPESPLAPLVTLDDVLTLKLNAEWVVLSACNTAASDGRGEEVLSGLARGFFYAGSRSLLVTQWAVDTLAAQRLTSLIFEHQASEPKASKAESLRAAMLVLEREKRFAHPAFWAAYMLVGDGAR